MEKVDQTVRLHFSSLQKLFICLLSVLLATYLFIRYLHCTVLCPYVCNAEKSHFVTRKHTTGATNGFYTSAIRYVLQCKKSSIEKEIKPIGLTLQNQHTHGKYALHSLSDNEFQV